MDKYRLQWVGARCGQHGPYTFYKSFKFHKESKWRTLSLGEFFFVKCSENDPLCIAELQLLWEDKGTEGIMLSSLRLYFLPEHTPDGRHHSHGENEVIAVNGKAIMSIEDLLDWVIMDDVRWIDGFPTICSSNGALPTSSTSSSSSIAKDESQGRLSPSNQEAEKETLEGNSGLQVKNGEAKTAQGCKDRTETQKLMVVSYPSYCRYHGILKRIENQGDKWRSNQLLKALGLFTLPHPHTKVLFCRDEFEHPMLEEDERLCEYTAPKLKGRPRKKKVKLKSDDERYEPPRNHSVAANSQNNCYLAGKRSSRLDARNARIRSEAAHYKGDTLGQLKGEFRRGAMASEELFLTHLYKYMKERNTPIDRVPHLGFKQIDLFSFFELAVQFGGYKKITSQKQWKVIYDQLGGNPGSTSAATCTRKHYERLLFPFEQYLRLPDKPGDGSSEGRERKKNKKDKKERKKSRVKHVREQLQELEAMRRAHHAALEAQKLQPVSTNNVIRSEAGEPISTVTKSTHDTTATSITTSSGMAPQDLKPPLSINGSPLMAMPQMMSPASMMQLAGSPLFSHQLGLKNMGQVILAIPQVPAVIAATSASAVPKTEGGIETVGGGGGGRTSHGQQQQQHGGGGSGLGDQKPLGLPSQPMVSTVLDKLGGSGVSLVVPGSVVNPKEEGTRDRSSINESSTGQHLYNHSVKKEENSVDSRSRSSSDSDGRRGGANRVNSPLANDSIYGSRESLVSRPSVIQHTQHTAVKREDLPTGLLRSPLVNAVQPNDLILRNMTQEQFAAEHEHYKKAVAEMPGLLGGPRFLSPYMTLLPQAPFLFRPPLDLPGQGVSSKVSVANAIPEKTQRAEESLRKTVHADVAPSKPLVSMVQPMKSSSNPSSSRSSKYAPEQEEPCDLSMPKKRRRYPEERHMDEPGEKRRESVISKPLTHSTSSSMIRNSPVHRLRTSDKKLHKHSSSSYLQSRDYHGLRMSSSSSSSHSSLSAPSLSSSSSSSKVKMTPNPRGSITQGIINPATIQGYPTLPSHKNLVDASKAPTPKSSSSSSSPSSSASPHDLASLRYPMEFPGLSLPMAVDSSGKPLPPLTDLNPLTRFPMIPYPYPLLTQSPFLPPGSPFLPTGLPPGIPTSQAETMLPQGFLFRPPFPFAPSVPYSTAQLPRDSTQASLYRS